MLGERCTGIIAVYHSDKIRALKNLPTHIHQNRHCGQVLVCVVRVTVTAQTFCVPPGELFNCEKRNTCLTMETGFRRKHGLMTDYLGTLPVLKTEAMMHLYAPNIPYDKTSLRKRLITVQPLNINQGQTHLPCCRCIISYSSQKL